MKAFKIEQNVIKENRHSSQLVQMEEIARFVETQSSDKGMDQH